VVFPLYDDNPFKLPVPPYATWALIAINVFIFMVTIGSSEDVQASITISYAVTPVVVTHSVGWSDLTLVTGMFLHGGWEHLLGNMVYLWVFGDDIEEALGPFRFVLFYLLAGVGASIAYVALNPNSAVPLVGASGAISGVLAAYLMLRPCAKVTVFVLRIVVRVRAYWVIGGWALLQLFLLAGKADDGVAYLAHVGGLAVGALLFLVLRPAGVKLFECMSPGMAYGAESGKIT
jgi:membrane associated rhomboid family serine protease